MRRGYRSKEGASHRGVAMLLALLAVGSSAGQAGIDGKGTAVRTLLQSTEGPAAELDPSQFVFSMPMNVPSQGPVVLTLNLELLGQQLVPFTAVDQAAVEKAFRQVLDSAIGIGTYTIQRVSDSSQANLPTLEQVLLEVQIVTDAQSLNPMLNQLQIQIQDAQLAGQLRAAGLYSLQTLDVVSYTIQAAPTPAPANPPHKPIIVNPPVPTPATPAVIAAPQEGLPKQLLPEPPAELETPFMPFIKSEVPTLQPSAQVPSLGTPPRLEPSAMFPPVNGQLKAEAPAEAPARQLPILPAAKGLVPSADEAAGEPAQQLSPQAAVQAPIQPPVQALVEQHLLPPQQLPVLPPTIPVPNLAQPVIQAPSPEPAAKPVILAPSPEPAAQPVIAAPAPEPAAKPIIPAPAPEPAAQPVIAAPAPEPAAQAVISAPVLEPAAQPVVTTPSPGPAAQPVISAPSLPPAAQPVIIAPTPIPSAQPVIVAPSPELAPKPAAYSPIPSPAVPLPQPSAAALIAAPAPMSAPLQLPEESSAAQLVIGAPGAAALLAAPAPMPGPLQAPSAAPTPTPGLQQLPILPVMPAFTPTSAAPNLGPTPSTAGPVAAPDNLAPAPDNLAPAPAPGPTGDVGFTLQLSGSSWLSEQNATALQAALAKLMGLSSSQVQVPASTPPSTISSEGRRLLHSADKPLRRLLQQNSGGSTMVPVTVAAGAGQQAVLQQLNALASSGNLTQALQSSGLNVTNARIVSINGQPTIVAHAPTQSPLPPSSVVLLAPSKSPAGNSSIIPIPQAQPWKISTILWAVLGGTIGCLVLGAICLCCFARWRSSKLPRLEALRREEEMKRADNSSTSTDISPRTGGGVWSRGSSDTAPPSKGALENNAEPIEVAEEIKDDGSEHASFASPAQDGQYSAGFAFVVPSKEQYPTDMDIAEVEEGEEVEEAGFEDPACTIPRENSLGTATMQEEVTSDLAGIAAAGIARLRFIADGASQSLESLASEMSHHGQEGMGPSSAQLADHAVMALIASGEVFAGKYMLEEGCIKGSRVIVVVGRERSHPGRNVLCKFFASHADFTHELQLHDMLPANSPVPGIADAFPRGTLPNSGLPGCIVSYQGDYTIAQWPTKLDRSPDFVQRRAAFHLVCKAVAELHRHKCVHGSLTPDNVLWFGAENMFRLSSFSFWAFNGAPILLHPALRYAAPEVIMAHSAGRLTVPASYALDVWSLGVIGFQIFAGQQLFSGAYEDADVLDCLLGNAPLPWEIDLMVFQSVTSADARNLIKNLLRREPGVRLNMEQILDHPLFEGLTVKPPTRLASMPRHPSFPRTVQPRITINPLRPPPGPATPIKGVGTQSPPAAPATPQQTLQAALVPGSATSSLPSESPEKDTSGIAANVSGTDEAAPHSPAESWDAALFGTPNGNSSDFFETPASTKVVQNALYAVGIDNPAYSADARSLPSRQESLRSPMGVYFTSEDTETLGIEEVAPSHNSQHRRAESASGIPPRQLHRWSDSGVGQLSGGNPFSRMSESGVGRAEGSSLLRTLSTAAGPARAGSVARWESLEVLETRSDVTSDAGDIGPFVLRTVLPSALKSLRGSALVVSICIEEVRPVGDVPVTLPSSLALHEALAAGTVQTVEAPMVPSKMANTDGPVFLMRSGGVFLLRVHVAAGSRRGWVPLMVSGPTKLRIGFGRSDEGESLDVVETESELSKWKGYAIWDSNTPRVLQMAGKFGQQTRINIATTFKRKGSDDCATVEHELFGILGQRVPSTTSYTPPEEFTSAVRPFPWAREASQGAVTFVKVIRQTRGATVD